MARGLVHGCVEWRSSRAFFFARLARRLLEQEAVGRLRRAQNPTLRNNGGQSCEPLLPPPTSCDGDSLPKGALSVNLN